MGPHSSADVEELDLGLSSAAKRKAVEQTLAAKKRAEAGTEEDKRKKKAAAEDVALIFAAAEASRVEDKKAEAIELMQLLESCRLEETWRVLLDYGVFRVSDLLELEPEDVDAFPITPIAKKKMARLVSQQREEEAATSAGATAVQGRRL